MVRILPSKPPVFSDLFAEYGNGSIARLPKHRNRGFELHYIEKGHLHWEVEGRTFLVPPGSVFFTFPWERHGSLGEFEPGHYFHFAVFRMQKSAKNHPKKVRLASGFSFLEREQQKIFAKLLSARERSFPADQDLAWAIVRLVKELTKPGPMGRPHVLALSQNVFYELVKNIDLAQSEARRHSVGEGKVLKLLENFRLKCSQPWTLALMASTCGLKRTQFEVLTKKLTGDTPLLLLNRYRIQRARVLLRESDKTVTEIAFEVGFESSQYFARVFQKLTGMTPSYYRLNHDSLKSYDQRFLKALDRL